MDKFETFFVNGEILLKEDYDLLKDHSDFEILLPNDKSAKIKVFLKIKKPLPIHLFKKIEIQKNKWKNQLLIDVKLDKYIEFSNEILKEYLKYFTEEKINANLTLKNFLISVPLITTDDGLIIFQYFNNTELQELKRNEVLLKNFFNSIGLKCTKIDYELDKERQSIEIAKQKKLEKIIKDQKFSLLDPLSAVKKDNEIGNTRITPIKDLLPELRVAVITGEVFEKKVASTRKGISIYHFSITDHNSAITIKAFAGKSNNSFRKSNLPEQYLDSIKIGDWVKAKVDLQIDSYAGNELTGLVQKLQKCKKNEELDYKDNAIKKRIELLARTKMSAFDGLISPNDLVKRSKKYGWGAISVIDRYDVQSFPDAMSASSKLNQKIIYGVEIDKMDRQIQLVLNPTKQKISEASYVVFDLETTGLFNEYEDIIEFGAVKVQNGVIVDTIDMFIKPSKPLPSKIIELTHITDAMLEDAKSIKQALKEIVTWIGDAVLVAHNGINFDYRFLNKKLVQNGFDPIKNTLIDTLQVSRTIHKDLFKHTLGAICRKYKIDYSDEIAHRADFDAEVLNKVWNIFQYVLKEQNILTLDQINTLQSEELYSRQFRTYANLYVKDQTGIREIYKIVSYSFTKNLFGTPRVFVDEIDKVRNNLIIASSPTEGEVWDSALNGLDSELEKAISYYDYIFVAPPANLLNEIDSNNISTNNVKKTIKKIIQTAKKLNKKVVAVSDAHYLDKTDQLAYKVYVNSKLLGGKRHRFYKYGSATTEVIPDLHLRTTQEMLDEFAFLQDEKLINEIVIDNSIEFNNLISNDIKPLKKGLFAPKIADATEKLQSIVWENAKKLYGDQLPELIDKRIKRELDGIVSNNYGIIYWISHLLVKKSLDDGYLVGSRGSVGSSLVAYLSNISEVNPLPPHYLCPHCKTSIFNNNVDDGYDLPQKLCPKCGQPILGNGHNIPFETFLGFHGEKVPDIDLNFSGEYQPRAHEFIREMFGKEHAFRAGTIATVASKTAYGYVMNYFEESQIDNPPRQSEINWIVSKCVDVKRTTGQHPGGIIIVPKEMDIFDFSPYNYPADDKSQNWFTSHFAFESLHDNLLKFDILGHDDPTTLRMLQNITNIDPKTIPFHDEAVMQLFSSLDSLNIKSEDFLNQKVGSTGLPEFGTGFVREMLCATKPKTFADLIRISGLSHGTDVWLGNAEDLISKMNMTLSDVIACRDDIMVYLINKGVNPSIAFETMESVRKGRKIPEKYIEDLRNANIPQWYLDSCNKIKYLFPKAHATAYVIMAWRIAWFKIHYPLAFYAAYFSIRCEVFDIYTITSGIEVIKEKIIDIKKRLNDKSTKKTVTNKEKDLVSIYEVALEMYLRGFKVKKPDLNKSLAKQFVIDGNSIIIPFNKIDKLGDVGAESIVNERTRRPFASKEDLMSRTKISKTILETLESMGVLDDLQEDNQLSLF